MQLEKYKRYEFGRCPRIYCSGQACLPVGQSDIPRSGTVKMYCPKCEDIYYPRSKYTGSILVACLLDIFSNLLLEMCYYLLCSMQYLSYLLSPRDVYQLSFVLFGLIRLCVEPSSNSSWAHSSLIMTKFWRSWGQVAHELAGSFKSPALTYPCCRACSK